MAKSLRCVIKTELSIGAIQDSNYQEGGWLQYEI